MDKDSNKRPGKIDEDDIFIAKTENTSSDSEVKGQASDEDKDSSFEHTARLRIITSEEIESTKRGINFKNKFSRKPLKTSSIYRKKYVVLWLVVILVFILAYQFVKVKDLDFKEASTQIENSVNMDNLQKGNILTLRKLYGINKNEVKDYISFAPKSNMIASEVLIIKSKPEYVDKIMNSIRSRVDSQANSFKSYAPDQFNIINNSELYKKGDYIYFLSSENLPKVKEAISMSYK